ncbi:hypothetical protein RHMOL_Rhmol07G0207500 [Rhododendron molle]|uniref:Uncharacterized protein n=1 Tax=Rhododendron molle TaxID=49168 RepID=A0ACC0N433_RHOML|nr:hypothetical protein RHMOL_Rhmol07G0207500 [Rhododendron molle]
MDSIWTKQRRLEALKLYYRVLQAMCTVEAQILQASNLTSLLTNERFHRCMLACSAELVLATHKTVTMLFPAILERTGITAFDLSKVIESFIRHEESLLFDGVMLFLVPHSHALLPFPCPSWVARTWSFLVHLHVMLVVVENLTMNL